MNGLKAAWAIMKNDLALNRAQPFASIITIVLPVNFLIFFVLFALSGGKAPVTVYPADTQPYAQSMVQALDHSLTFRVHSVKTEAEGQAYLAADRSVASIGIPSGFSGAVATGKPSDLQVTIDNKNKDFADDIRRGLPLDILDFYRRSKPEALPLQWREKDAYPFNVSFLGYLSVSVLTVALLVGGLLLGGRGVAREWETGTMKELMLAPVPGWSVVAGKLGAGLVNGLAAALLIVFGLILLGVKPGDPAQFILVVVLLLLVFVSLGVAAGSLLRSQSTVTPLAFALGLPLFFISGAFSPISWSTPASADIARIFPVVYANAVLQHSVHGYWPIDVSGPVLWLILILWTVGALSVSVWIYRRSTATH
ncbi:inner membrane transport permease YbhR [Peptococcaceae bacterium CEB3]|nr:inner membrane transport permease YbhR [Peptococcaceae bacterium CEB3]